MRTELDFGILIDKEGEPFPSVASLETFIPEDHRYLLRFLQTDLENIRVQIQRGIEEQDASMIKQARDALLDAHPFMRLDISIPNAYVNSELARASWEGKAPLITPENFERLGIFTDQQSRNLDDYLIVSDKDGYGSVRSLKDYQDNLKYITFIILDQSNPHYRNVPQDTRFGIYGLISTNAQGGDPEIRIPASRIVLSRPKAFDTVRAYMDFEEGYAEKVYDAVDSLIRNPTANSEVLDRIIASVNGQENTEACEMYTIPYLESLFDLEVYQMIRDRIRMGTCATCGKYFTYREDSDEIEKTYCDTEKEGGRLSCRAKARESMLGKNLSAVYTRTYRTLFARMSNGKMTKAELDEWRETAKQSRGKAIRGEITMEEYEKEIAR